MSSSSDPEGPGSVSGAPNVPAGFTDTFTSRYIDTGELRLHAVIGGVSTVGTCSASAATPQCGPHCIQILSATFGTNAHPTFVETVFQEVARVGQPTILARPSSSNPAGDLIATASRCSRAALRARPCGSSILPIRPRPPPPASGLSAARPRTSPTRSR